MSKAKFTKGPWGVPPDFPSDIYDSEGYYIADLYERDTIEEQAANAALIAAAPDLLEALEEMMVHAEYFFPHKEGFERTNAAYAAAERAILKAYGEK
jgi:hypothetical protein